MRKKNVENLDKKLSDKNYLTTRYEKEDIYLHKKNPEKSRLRSHDPARGVGETIDAQSWRVNPMRFPSGGEVPKAKGYLSIGSS